MRYKYTIFLVILLLGTFFISGHFFHSTKAAGQFAPMDVGDLPPLIRVSQLLGSDHANRTLQMSVGLKVRNQDQLNALLHVHLPPIPGLSTPDLSRLTLWEFSSWGALRA